jgi:hypothetical protein
MHHSPEYRAYIISDDNHFSGFEPLFCTDNWRRLPLPSANYA